MKTLKIGKNKGLARIWLERKILSENGWRKGQRFAVHVLNDEILLTVDSLHNVPSDPPSRHRVSGSDERPVIDLNGQWLQDFFDRFADRNLWVPIDYTVDASKVYGLIIITPVLTTIDNRPFLPVTKRRPQSMRRFDDVFEEVRHG